MSQEIENSENIPPSAGTSSNYLNLDHVTWQLPAEVEDEHLHQQQQTPGKQRKRAVSKGKGKSEK